MWCSTSDQHVLVGGRRRRNERRPAAAGPAPRSNGRRGQPATSSGQLRLGDSRPRPRTSGSPAARIRWYGAPSLSSDDGAQRLVAGHDVGDARPAARRCPARRQPHDQRDSCRPARPASSGRAATAAAGRTTAARARAARRRGSGGRAGAAAPARHGQAGARRWGLEQVADRQLGAERGAGAADQPGGEQRVPAEVEEVVLDADGRQPEHLGEQRHRIASVRGLAAGPPAERRPSAPGRAAPAVELAVGGQRQPSSGDDSAEGTM